MNYFPGFFEPASALMSENNRYVSLCTVISLHIVDLHHFQPMIDLILNSTEAETKILLPEVLSFMNLFTMFIWLLNELDIYIFSSLHIFFHFFQL